MDANLEGSVVCSKPDARNVLQPDGKSPAAQREKKEKDENFHTSNPAHSNPSVEATVFDPLPEVPLGADVWANAEINVEACLLHQLDEANQIVSPFEVILQPCEREPVKHEQERRLGPRLIPVP